MSLLNMATGYVAVNWSSLNRAPLCRHTASRCFGPPMLLVARLFLASALSACVVDHDEGAASTALRAAAGDEGLAGYLYLTPESSSYTPARFEALERELSTWTQAGELSFVVRGLAAQVKVQPEGFRGVSRDGSLASAAFIEATGDTDLECLDIGFITTDPAHRGEGAATALVGYLAREAAASKTPCLTTLTRVTALQTLLRKLGFMEKPLEHFEVRGAALDAVFSKAERLLSGRCRSPVQPGH